MCTFFRLLFVLFVWPLCCLFIFDLRILITSLVSSNSSSSDILPRQRFIWFTWNACYAILKIGGELRCSERVGNSCSSSYKPGDEERTRKCLRQVEHIHGHLWHIYSITVHQVMVVTVRLSKWWFQLNQESTILIYNKLILKTNSNFLSDKLVPFHLCSLIMQYYKWVPW
jgi:hypothetical protein